jgi:predicted secreted hydrolase
MRMKRRDWLRALSAVLLLPLPAGAAASGFAPVVPGRVLRFPQDEGSHPEFRTEWWYVTGWLETDGSPLGFQVTFFRSRPHPDSANPSRFAPRHILIAHAAISDPAHGRLRHAQRAARAGFGLAEAAIGRTEVRIDDWYLAAKAGSYVTRIDAEHFGFELTLSPTQPPLLQGQAGYSRKGPNPLQASYYYSLPQLAAEGRVHTGKQTRAVRGAAWLDHEWSSQYLAAEAVGWDWIGINFDDGTALMAFRVRARDGSVYWSAATLRPPGGPTRTFEGSEVGWTPLRTWRSPRTGATYPVAFELRVGALEIALLPLFDDQENDARITTGAIYWEGAVTALIDGRRVGRGYLELTGYAGKLEL